MRIAYCTNVRLPGERAHSHQVAHVCDALIKLGHEVTIFAPYRRNPVTEDFHAYHHADPKILIEYVTSFDPISSSFFPGVFGLWTLNILLRRALQQKLSGFDLLYTRSPALLSTMLSTSIPVVVELHQLPTRSRSAFVRDCNRCAIVACLTSPMCDELIAWGVDAHKIIVAGDAVDMKRFAQMPSREEARTHFSLQTGRPVVGYVGRLKTLGQEKGVGDLLKATAALKKTQPVFSLIVGGPESDKKEYEAMAEELGLTSEDVLCTGEVPSHDVPTALTACDMLAMPFPDLPHYRTNMSPLKMFEYMAAGKPIITSDLPTIRDVLSEETAYFCKPGDDDDLARVIGDVVTHKEEAAARAARARALADDYTWEKRMDRILSALPS